MEAKVMEFELVDKSVSGTAFAIHLLESLLAEYSSLETEKERMEYLRRQLNLSPEDRTKKARQIYYRAEREFKRTQ